MLKLVRDFISEKTAAAKADAALKVKEGAVQDQLKAESVKRTEILDKDLLKKAADEKARALFRKLRWGAAVVAVLALGADYLYHDNETFMRWRMKYNLKHYHASLPSHLLAWQRPPFHVFGKKLTMLLAPSGSGKTTLLQTYAAELAADGTPVLVVHMRLGGDQLHSRAARKKAKAGGAEKKELAPTARLDTIVQELFKQIAYPERESVWVRLLQQGFSVKGTTVPSVQPASTRIINALTMLFEVCLEIYDERIAAGMSEEDARPVLLFDEVQDLIKDERLADIGGEEIFLHLSKLLVKYVVDKKRVRAAVAGSSAELKNCFLQRTVAKGKRWRYYELPDPDTATVMAELLRKHISPEDAKLLVELCGTRLRLLEEPLAEGRTLDVQRFLAEEQDLACSDVRDFLKALPAADRETAAAVLDRLAAREKGAAKEEPAASQSRAAGTPITAPMPLSALPMSAQKSAYFSLVFYITKENNLRLQSKQMLKAWDTCGPSWREWQHELLHAAQKPQDNKPMR